MFGTPRVQGSVPTEAKSTVPTKGDYAQPEAKRSDMSSNRRRQLGVLRRRGNRWRDCRPGARPLIGLRLVVPLICWMAGLFGLATSAYASEASSALEASFVVPGVQVLDGNQQVRDAQRARLSSPEAVAARVLSQTAYAGFSAEQASKVDGEAFPAMIEEPGGGPPRLSAGQQIIGFPTDNAAQVEFGGGKHGVIDSVEPIAIETSPERRTPINLALTRAGSGFQPVTPAVAVRVPVRLGEGVQLPAMRVSMTPVDSQGIALGGSEGAIDGSAVFYANTQTDSDMVIKPVTAGFESNTILRSSESPAQLFFKIGLPQGAGVVEAHNGSGDAEIVLEGQTIALISAPTAFDAAGTQVPISMTVSGDTVALTVSHRGGSYLYPVQVDPMLTATDSQLTGLTAPTNWKFGPVGALHFKSLGWGTSELILESTTTYGPGETGFLKYQTQGASRIFETYLDTVGENKGNVETYLQLAGSLGLEHTLLLAASHGSYGRGWYRVCASYWALGSCTVPDPHHMWEYAAEHNWVTLAESTTAEGTLDNIARAYNANVHIAQEARPYYGFDNYSATLPNGTEENGHKVYVENVLKSGGWLGPASGAFRINFHDPGVGLSIISVFSGPWVVSHNFISEKKCSGIQCYGELNETFTYSSAMPNGEDKVEATAHDAVGLVATTSSATVKVDGTRPHNIKLGGALNGHEIGAGESQFTVEATDGEGSTPSSGIKSITVSIDGRQLGAPTGHCSPGPCTTKGEWTVAGRNYAPGQHSLIVSAIDNANNIAREEFPFAVHQASPVAVGPGQINPESGEFSLSATDVSLGSGLGLSRSYNSRQVTAGAEGALGPQWKASLGGQQTLTELLTGSIVLHSPGGGQTIFALKNGEYTPPKGDGNLTLTATKSGGVITEFRLTDNRAHATTVFTLPSGAVPPTPVYIGTFGSKGSGNGQVNSPTNVTSDAEGDVWVADTANNRIEEFSPTRTFMRAIGTAGSGEGQFSSPSGVAVSKTTGNLYVSDRGNSRVEEFSSSGGFIRSFGSLGSGEGQLKNPAGLAADENGNVWVCDLGNNRMEEFSAEGVYEAISGSEGTENGKFKSPTDIAVSGGNLYITDAGNNRVQELTPAGSYVGQFGASGSGNGQFSSPYGIAADPNTGNLYVVDGGNVRVEEFNSAGTYLSKFGTFGTAPGDFSTPTGIAASPLGSLYVFDNVNSTVQEWEIPLNRSVWMPTIAEGPVATSIQTYAYQTVQVEGKTVTEPTEELAPIPAGVSCSAEGKPKLEKGCRAMFFKYATETTATGENQGEWGEYNGRLVEVTFTAYNPATSSMATTAVAKYSYDKQGRLRAEWDPRITSSPLKTTYGYDAEGHLTATSPPGQQPWLFHYGMIAGDTTSGRLLSITRPAASTTFGTGEAPKNTAVPVLSSTTPAVGAKISVSSNGSWSNNPLAYSYQWEDCSPSGTECVAISGAVNQNYYPVTSDVGHTLVAQVNATNAFGATAATSAATSVVATGTLNTPLPEPPNVGTSAVWTVEYNIPTSGTGLPSLSATSVEAWAQKDDPVEGAAIFPPDEPMGWPAADYKRATISYLDSQGRIVNTALPSGGIATNEYNELNDVVRGLSPDNRAAALKEGSKSAEVSKQLDTQSVYNEEGSQLLETRGPEHKVKLTSGTEVSARNHVKYAYDENAPEGGHFGLATKVTDGAEYEGKESDIRETTTSYSGQNNLGWRLRKATSVTVDPGVGHLNLTRTTKYNETTGRVTETTTPAGEEKSSLLVFDLKFGSWGSTEGKLEAPVGVAVDPRNGNVYVADYSLNRAEKFSASGSFLGWVGSETSGSGEGQLSHPEGIAVSASGNVYIGDAGNRRVEEFNAEGHYVRAWGTEGIGSGQFSHTINGLAFDANGKLWVTDGANHRVQEFSETGVFERKFGEQGTGEGKFEEPTGIVVSGGNLYITDLVSDRVDKYNLEGHFVGQFGSYGMESGQLREPFGIAADSKGDLIIADKWPDKVEEFSSSGKFLAWLGSSGTAAGQFENPDGITSNSSGSLYVADQSNSRIDEWIPGNQHTHTTKVIPYTAKEEAEAPACRNHPEWAELPCVTMPAAQPGTPGLQELPTTTTTYNIWDQPEIAIESFGSTIRTKKTSFDGAGRKLSSEITSTIDTALPKVTSVYNSATGGLEKESTTVGETTKTITSVTNTLGQLTSYTDADGATTTYTYDVDGRTKEVSYPLPNSTTGKQTYGYDTTTGFLKELVDSAAGTFTAAYDVGGYVVSQTYPDKLTANYTYSSTDEATALEYKKAAFCGTSCTWFSDVVVPSIHGETMKQSSTLAEEPNYSYDAMGRITQVQEIPAGKGCTTRVYTYDEESNRTSLMTRNPTSEGKCGGEGWATEHGNVETHSYDTANRPTDAGVTYETFGNITKLPAADAGGHELTDTYYADNQLYTQAQNGETIEYKMDPEGRTRETVSIGTTTSTTVSHYAGSGNALSWTSETSEKWSRNIPGIGDELAATQTNGETPVLQLHDLKGNIIATAAKSETETKLLSTYNSSEFGVPTAPNPPKYSWLGAAAVTSELSSTGVVSQGGSSYVPEIGRPLQTQPIRPPGAYAYGSFSGTPYTTQLSPESIAQSISYGTGAPGRESERQAELRRRAEEDAAAANAPPGQTPSIIIEDPYWVWTFTIRQAEQLASQIKGAEGYLTVTKLGAFVKKVLGIDFVAQVEALIQEAIFGFSRDQVEGWGSDLANGLGACSYEALIGYGHPNNPHCWVGLYTVKYSIGIDTPLGFIGPVFEVPNFAAPPQVGYCPRGTKYCYEV